VSFPDSPGSGASTVAGGLLIVGMIVAGMIGFGALAGAPSDTNPDVIVMGLVIDMGLGGADRIFSGFAWNFAMQPAQQKKYSFPSCRVLYLAVAGFTSIPQTGSFCLAGDDAAFVSAGCR
jgi:hypothetical protein